MMSKSQFRIHAFIFVASFIFFTHSTGRIPFQKISRHSTLISARNQKEAPHVSEYHDVNKDQLIREICDLTGYTNSLRTGWKKVKDKGTAKVWRRKVDWTPWMQIRTWGIVEAPPEFCLDLLLDNARVGSYDSLFDGIDVVEAPDSKTVVRHMLYKAIWPTSPRDFITYTTNRSLVPGKKKSGYVIASKSVLHTSRPATRQRCRGTIFHFGYTLEPYTLEDGSIGSQVRMCAHMDLAGGMPASIINFLSSSQPLGVMQKIQDIARREYCGEMDSIGPLFAASQKLGMPSQIQAFASKIDQSCEGMAKSLQSKFSGLSE